MKIKIFSHAMDLFNDTKITLEQTKLLEDTGLLDAADEMHMMLHFNEKSFYWLKDRWKGKNNVQYHLFDESYREWYESSSIHYLQEYCHATDEEYYVLFMTHKGISHPPGGHQNWRTYMQYWNVQKWKECVEKLDEGYETCGAAFLSEPPYPFYAGNFFWARASYLRRCYRLKTPPENDYKPQFTGQPHHRYDYECWNGSGNPKWYDMHPGASDRWYLPPETYMKNAFRYSTT